MFENSIEFNKIGNYRIISWNDAFMNIETFDSWEIDVDYNNNSDVYLYLEYRWSTNGFNWSLWRELSQNNIQNIPISSNNPFWIEIRITLSSNIIPVGEKLSNPVILQDFKLNFTYKVIDLRDKMFLPSPICSKEMSNYPIVFTKEDFTFKPYDINRGINLYQDLSHLVNNVFGIEATYYSVQPHGRGKDVVLKEYTLFNVVEEKCIKIMIPNNVFPDSAITFETWGLNFQQPFEIHIDRKYFESIFGKGSQPRRRDIIFIPMMNRIFQIDSMYVFKDINNYPVYFKIALVKYEVNKNITFLDSESEKSLKDYTVNTEDLFGKEIEEQQTETTKPQQYAITSQRRIEDPIRSYIDKNLPIIEYDLNNNWTIVFNNYYDLNQLFIDHTSKIDSSQNYLPINDAIRWKVNPILKEDEERSFTCWFKVRNFTDGSKLVSKPAPILNISDININNNEIIYTTIEPHNLRIGENPDGYVSIYAENENIWSGGYEILEIIDEHKFKVKNYNINNNAPQSTNGWKAQKAQSRNLFDGYYNNKGLKIDFIWSGTNNDQTSYQYIETGSFMIKINDLEIISSFGRGITNNSLNPFILSLDDWYAFVFNFSNIYKQYSIKIWGLTYNPDDPSTQTSDLTLLHSLEGNIQNTYTFDIEPQIEEDYNSVFYKTNNFSYKIKPSPIWITNFRFFKYMIPEEKQSAILNQNIIKDAQLALIIDNAKPILKLPFVARNR